MYQGYQGYGYARPMPPTTFPKPPPRAPRSSYSQDSLEPMDPYSGPSGAYSRSRRRWEIKQPPLSKYQSYVEDADASDDSGRESLIAARGSSDIAEHEEKRKKKEKSASEIRKGLDRDSRVKATKPNPKSKPDRPISKSDRRYEDDSDRLSGVGTNHTKNIGYDTPPE